MADTAEPNMAAGFEAASTTFSTATRSVQGLASEMQRMSKEQMEAASELMEKLRGAKTLEELVTIQTSFMQKSFMSYADYTRRFGEMMMSVPMEFAKQGQTAFNRGVNEVAKTAEQVGDQAQKAGQHFTHG